MKGGMKVMTIRVYRDRGDKSYSTKVTFEGMDVDVALAPGVVVESIAQFVGDLDKKARDEATARLGILVFAKSLLNATEYLVDAEGGEE